MIKPDDVTVFDEQDKQDLDVTEQKIDELLRASKGYAEVKINMSTNDAAAFWHEIARRYKRSGWCVEYVKPRGMGESPKLVVAHPAYDSEASA